ncbi:amino acid transporter [Amycolatopsis mediterranei]|uniref:nucleotidyltransferase domain-containing protein n=1 Tax=Amycolatopsis mediterranei TaxID=33910 RepID=UPI003428A44E
MSWEPAPLPEVAELFSRAGVPWWIAGGHAIELAVGRGFRAHGDVDVLLLRRDQLAVQAALPSWEWWAAEPPGTLRPWARGEVLGAGVDDVWCRPSAAAPWRIQVMLDEARGDEWISRRNPAVRREIARLGERSPEGLPYLAPEVQLFAKAHGTRPKDEQDFAAALPVLSAAQRRWLARALETTYGPHPWLGRL